MSSVHYSSLSRNSLDDGLDLDHKRNQALFTKTSGGPDLAQLCACQPLSCIWSWQTGLQLLENAHAHLFTSSLWLLSRFTWVGATETVRPTKPKTLNH